VDAAPDAPGTRAHDDQPAAAGPASGPTVVERLWPGAWVWFLTLIVAASFALVVARFDARAAVATLVVATVVLVCLLVASTPEVGVRGGAFVAGRATVPITLVGSVEVLDAAAMRHAVGPGLDARSYLCLRGWIGQGLRLELRDPADPTPSWVVSSRRPQVLAAAVEAARRG
jgi:hypothetical protein